MSKKVKLTGDFGNSIIKIVTTTSKLADSPIEAIMLLQLAQQFYWNSLGGSKVDE